MKLTNLEKTHTGQSNKEILPFSFQVDTLACGYFVQYLQFIIIYLYCILYICIYIYFFGNLEGKAKKVQPAQETEVKKHCIDMAKKLTALDVYFEVVTGSVVLLSRERPPHFPAAVCSRLYASNADLYPR